MSHLKSLYTRQLKQITGSILNDDPRPWHTEFHPPQRFTVSKCRTKGYKNSFVPAASTQTSRLGHQSSDDIDGGFISLFLFMEVL